MLLKFNNETEWLEARHPNINSTDIAALFGLSKWKSRLRLWHEKAGNVEPSDLGDNPFAKWGRRLQIPIGMGICEDNGWRGEDLSLLYFVDNYRMLGASMDIKAICPDRGDGLLEIKKTTSLTEEYGWFDDKAPIEYEFQIQTQMHLAIKDDYPIKWGGIGVLDSRNRDRVYPRSYDKDLGKMIDKEVDEFFKSIHDNIPPPPDYAVDGEILERLRAPVRPDEGLNLSRNNRAVELIHRWHELDIQNGEINKKLKPIEEERLKIRAEIHHIMGKAEKATIGDFIVSAREQTVEERVTLDYKFRRFDVKKAKRRK